jgi:hypothetical protein
MLFKDIVPKNHIVTRYATEDAVLIVNSFYCNLNYNHLHANIPFYLLGSSGIHLETSKTADGWLLTAWVKSKSKSHYDWQSVSQ